MVVSFLCPKKRPRGAREGVWGNECPRPERKRDAAGNARRQGALIGLGTFFGRGTPFQAAAAQILLQSLNDTGHVSAKFLWQKKRTGP
jgi:hypothetical protein